MKDDRSFASGVEFVREETGDMFAFILILRHWLSSVI